VKEDDLRKHTTCDVCKRKLGQTGLPIFWTVTTRDRFGLVQAYGLDITFRMLQPHELARAQGFPDSYWFAGTKTDQVKQIGNAVPVHTARAIAREGLSA